VQELAYKNSGDVTGDRRRVVGYPAMAIVMSSQEAHQPEPMLSAEARRALIELARRTIEAAVRQEPLPPVPSQPEPLDQPRAAFVTIERDHRLRGCIGYTQPVGSLAETVREAAIGAALHDPRFRPVDPAELDVLALEISVLSPLTEVTDPAQIQVGTHGLIVRKGRASGLLLPQVATEYGWDRQKFLEETCRKAGLPTTAWKDPDTKLYLFTAEVFAE
jgi:AmmeMemoRadiSam system protein A